MATNQEIAEEKKQQLYGLLTEKHSARRNEAAKLHASTISVLQHLTHARHMCYKRMFVLENCLRWQKPKMMVDPKTCAKAKTLFQACNAELYVMVCSRVHDNSFVTFPVVLCALQPPQAQG